MANEVDFEQKPDEDEPEPLRIEHFYFPLGMWMAGILISAFFLLAEIIFHRITDVPVLMEKEPSVTHSKLEVENNRDVEDIEDTKA